jgi:undecaprenyl-diphosphatase
LLICLLFALGPLAAQTPSTPAAKTPTPRVTVVSAATPASTSPVPTATDSVVLGLVEGITEFLPVSSTGHLIITTHLLGLDGSTVIAHDRKGRPQTMKDAADTYTVIIQVGAIAAVALLYWSQLSRIIAGLAGRDPAGLRLLRNLILACIPPVITALAFKGFIKEKLFSVPTVAGALLAGAALMLYAEWWRRRAEAEAPAKASMPELTPSDLSPKQALIIGCVQCFALWPGMSRSMTAMVAGYFVGLRPVRAAEFSFLIGLPLLGAAAAKDALDGGAAVIAAFGWMNMSIGLVVAFASAALAVRLLVTFLNKHGLSAFAWYRIALALVLARVIIF